MESLSVMQINGSSVSVAPRTVCESTGLTCKGREVYENDWLSVEGDGEIHKFLVVWAETQFRAFEDEDISYDLKSVLESDSCCIVGNLYD